MYLLIWCTGVVSLDLRHQLHSGHRGLGGEKGGSDDIRRTLLERTVPPDYMAVVCIVVGYLTCRITCTWSFAASQIPLLRRHRETSFLKAATRRKYPVGRWLKVARWHFRCIVKPLNKPHVRGDQLSHITRARFGTVPGTGKHKSILLLMRSG